MRIYEIVSLNRKPDQINSPSFRETGWYWQDIHDSHDWQTSNPKIVTMNEFILEIITSDYTNRYVIFGYPHNNKIPKRDIPYESQVAFFVSIEGYNDGFRINDVRVEPQFRKNRIGIKLYLMLSDFFKKPIYSGRTQTQHSKNGIWYKLIDLYPDRVVGFDPKKKTDLPLTILKYGPAVYHTQAIYNKAKTYDMGRIQSQEEKTRLLKLLPI